MTHDEIIQMTSEQLRLAIAEVKKLNVHKSFGTLFYSGIVNDGSPSDNIPDEWGQIPLPYWERNISAAWDLVEEMGLHNWSVTIENLPERKQEVICRVFLPRRQGEFMGSAETAPLAICRAWLMWKEKA